MRPTLRRTPNWLTALVVALLLSVTQLGYDLHKLAHAIAFVTHGQVDEPYETGHGHSGHPGHDTCLLCVAYAAMAGGIPAVFPAALAAATEILPYSPPAIFHSPRHEAPYSPRAPPALRA